MLADQNYFNDNAMSLLRSFLQHLMGPICFIAHNGRCFDFPLLKKELSTLSGSLPSEVGCCDSIPVFKTLTGYNYASYKLNEIHNEIFNSYPESSHCAEADALTLLKCALSFGEDFVEAVNRIRVSFTWTFKLLQVKASQIYMTTSLQKIITATWSSQTDQISFSSKILFLSTSFITKLWLRNFVTVQIIFNKYFF